MAVGFPKKHNPVGLNWASLHRNNRKKNIVYDLMMICNMLRDSFEIKGFCFALFALDIKIRLNSTRFYSNHVATKRTLAKRKRRR